jgi:hypothetical protein
LPVLQPEPPAWLTTGLMKGSRLPFALNLLFGATCCSLVASPLPDAPLPAAVASAGGSFLGATTVGFGAALRLALTAGTRFAPPVFFTPAAEVFTGVTTATPLGLAGAWVALAAAGVDG